MEQFLTEFWKVVILPVLFGIGWMVKRYFSKVDNAETNAETAQVNAYEQLSKLFSSLQTQVERSDLRDREKDDEIEKLEQCVSDIREKVKTARLDLIDLKQSLKDIRRFLKRHNINDEEIFGTIAEIERVLQSVGDCLKEKK